MESRDRVTGGLGVFLLTLMTMAAMAAIVMGARALGELKTLEPPATHIYDVKALYGYRCVYDGGFLL